MGKKEGSRKSLENGIGIKYFLYICLS